MSSGSAKIATGEARATVISAETMPPSAVAGTMLTCLDRRMMVKVPAKVKATQSAAKSPSKVPSPRPSQNTSAMPRMAERMAAQVTGRTNSRRNTPLISAAKSGEAARMTSTLATCVWVMA